MVVLNEKNYPSIHEVCDMYDVYVTQGVTDPVHHAPACPARDNSPAQGIFFECTCPPVAIYSLGQSEDLSAGLYAYDLTPYFNTLDELEQFCYRNMDEFLRCMDRPEELNLSKLQ